MDNEKFQKAFVILLVVAISIAFVQMIRPFLLTILLAGIFSALSLPLYKRFLRLYRDHAVLASLTTLLIIVVVIAGPMLFFLGRARRASPRGFANRWAVDSAADSTSRPHRRSTERPAVLRTHRTVSHPNPVEVGPGGGRGGQLPRQRLVGDDEGHHPVLLLFRHHVVHDVFLSHPRQRPGAENSVVYPAGRGRRGAAW